MIIVKQNILKVNILKAKKNQRFNYTPRYYQGKDVGNIYSFGSKFEKYRDTVNANDVRAHWTEARQLSRTRSNRGINTRMVIIFAVLLLIFLWIIDFDLSIFSNPY